MPQFLILANDFTDPDALNRRMSVREKHLQRMRIEKTAGRFIVGGAKLTAQGTMHGSMLVVNLDNEEAVKEWIAEDPYIQGSVWEQVEILPFRIAEV